MLFKTLLLVTILDTPLAHYPSILSTYRHSLNEFLLEGNLEFGILPALVTARTLHTQSSASTEVSYPPTKPGILYKAIPLGRALGGFYLFPLFSLFGFRFLALEKFFSPAPSRVLSSQLPLQQQRTSCTRRERDSRNQLVPGNKMIRKGTPIGQYEIGRASCRERV